jgi:hypothetical protein
MAQYTSAFACYGNFNHTSLPAMEEEREEIRENPQGKSRLLALQRAE